ncbi:MAG: hypothetical protein ACQEXE_18060 [Bacillota bacterium]
MGSRVMHSIINNEIASRMKIEDKAAFLLGGIAPDAVSPKDLSHFYKGNTDEYTRRIDYKSFLNKYRSKSHSPYYPRILHPLNIRPCLADRLLSSLAEKQNGKR